MIADVSHLSEGRFMMLQGTAQNPLPSIPFVRQEALRDHQRNLADDQLRCIADMEVGGAEFYAPFLKEIRTVHLSAI